MRRLCVSLIALLMILSLPLVKAAAGGNQPPSRELQGHVRNKAEVPLPDSVVYLKNARTMAVKTFITGKDGSFRFPALAPNVDYTVYAERKGKRSETKTLSQFDSRTTAVINLKIEAEP